MPNGAITRAAPGAERFKAISNIFSGAVGGTLIKIIGWLLFMLTFYKISGVKSLTLLIIIASVSLFFTILGGLEFILFFIVIPSVALFALSLLNIPILLISVISLIFYFVIIAAYFKSREKERGVYGFLSFFATLIFLLLLLSFASAVLIPYDTLASILGKDFANVLQENIRTPVEKLGIDITSLYDIKRPFEKQIALAIGEDYYTGEVDKKSEEQLGVFLENVGAEETLQNSPAIVHGTLKARVVESPVAIRLSCSVEGEKGILKPRGDFYVEDYEEQEIECLFTEGFKEPKVYEASLKAEFNFKTMSYYRTAFMEKEMLKSEKRQGKDPLEKRGITLVGTAVYTQGPVRIGMKLSGTTPFAIALEEPETTMLLGITIENAWRGKINSLKRFVLIVPKGIEVSRVGIYPAKASSCEALPLEERKACDEQTNSVFEVQVPGFLNTFAGLTGFKTYNAELKLPQAKYREFLGPTNFILQTFKLTIDYDYEYESKTSLTIRAGSSPTAP